MKTLIGRLFADALKPRPRRPIFEDEAPRPDTFADEDISMITRTHALTKWDDVQRYGPGEAMRRQDGPEAPKVKTAEAPAESQKPRAERRRKSKRERLEAKIARLKRALGEHDEN